MTVGIPRHAKKSSTDILRIVKTKKYWVDLAQMKALSEFLGKVCKLFPNQIISKPNYFLTSLLKKSKKKPTDSKYNWFNSETKKIERYQ